MSKRKPLSKGLRFGIFKRDAFRCVYCGAHPPAVLHIDHVVPVAEGGSNEQDNLVTACEACNLGKSATPLTVVPKPLAQQAAETAEREEQLAGYQAILKARRDRLEDEQWEIVHALESSRTDSYRRDWLLSIKRFLEKLGLEAVLDAAEIAKARYPYGGRRVFLYFCGICWKRVREPEE